MATFQSFTSFSVLGLSTLFFHSTGYALDFALPVPQTVDESKAGFEARHQRVIDYYSNATPMNYLGGSNIGFFYPRLARLLSSKDVTAINDYLNSSIVRVSGEVGSDFDALGPFCKRVGDYDFILQEFIDLYAVLKDKPEILWPETQSKLLNVLLNQRGFQPQTTVRFGICGTYPESENHILMIESARYLTNQFLHERALKTGEGLAEIKNYNNETNGQEAWLLGHLSLFLKRDFFETTSRPYQGYTVMALERLYRNASSEKIKSICGNILDYLSAKYAIQSQGLKRLPSFRRQLRFWNDPNVIAGDYEFERMSLLVGPQSGLKEIGFYIEDGMHFMLMAGLSGYHIPDFILKRFLERGPEIHFQTFKQGPFVERKNAEGGVEAYAQGQNFTISAGGKYVDGPYDFGTLETDVAPQPTVLLLSHHGMKRADLIRFDGNPNPIQRSNLCVSASKQSGIACGYGFKLPASLPEACIERKVTAHGEWMFLDLTEANSKCDWKESVWIAVFKAVDSDLGVLEVVDISSQTQQSTSGLAYESFKTAILKNNNSLSLTPGKESDYTLLDGGKIWINPMPSEFGIYPVRKDPASTSKTYFPPRFTDTWPLAKGTWMNVVEPGLIQIGKSKSNRIAADFF